MQQQEAPTQQDGSSSPSSKGPSMMALNGVEEQQSQSQQCNDEDSTLRSTETAIDSLETTTASARNALDATNGEEKDEHVPPKDTTTTSLPPPPISHEEWKEESSAVEREPENNESRLSPSDGNTKKDDDVVVSSAVVEPSSTPQQNGSPSLSPDESGGTADQALFDPFAIQQQQQPLPTTTTTSTTDQNDGSLHSNTTQSTAASPLNDTATAPVDSNATQQQFIKELQAQLQQQEATEQHLRAQNQALSQQLTHSQHQQAQSVRAAQEQFQTALHQEKDHHQATLQQLQHELSTAHQHATTLESTVSRYRKERDDHEQHRMALAARLNRVQKTKASIDNHTEQYQSDLQSAHDEIEALAQELQTQRAAYTQLERDHQHAQHVLQETQEYYTTQLETAHQRNHDRVATMKQFVSQKTEELRQALQDTTVLQTELSQMNHTLVTLNKKCSDYHTQSKQAQARMREYQRDYQRLQQDSAHLSTQGDTMERKLSRSATETQEHKQKRVAAKQELLHALSVLEEERSSVLLLQERLKFVTLRNHQQQLNQGQQELKEALEKLSLKLVGQATSAPPPQHNGHTATTRPSTAADGPHADVFSLVERLEQESLDLETSLQSLLHDIHHLGRLAHASSGTDRSCFTVLSELVLTGARPAALQHATQHMLTQVTTTSTRSGYGQVVNKEEENDDDTLL